MIGLATSTIFVFLFVSGCTVEQPRFETTAISSWGAVSRGEPREALAAYESQALEAEKSALSSMFPQQYWEAAALAYKYAARAARNSGQLQKAIDYAEKALETAEKTKEPRYMLNAIQELIWAYRSVRNFEKSSEYLQKGFEIIKQIPINTNNRVNWESLLYDLQGQDLMRRREYLKAADAYQQALYANQNWLSRLRPTDRDVQVARTNMIIFMASIGTAYRRAKRVDQALEQYQGAFNLIKEWSLKYPYENVLYEGIGEVYIQQRNFPEALENYQKALALAESQRRPDAVRIASARLAYILRETGKPGEAVPHYQKAVQQIESIRSLLGSEEYRQSYFEGVVGTYSGAIVALLASGKWEEAFNYSEKARSRAFLDVLGSKVQLSRVKSGLLEEERSLQERISALKAKLGGEEEPQGADVRKELREAERAYNVFLARLRKADKEQASLMTVKPLTLKEVQDLIDPGTTLVSYFITGRNIRVWIVEKDRFQYLPIRLRKEKLFGLVKSLRESMFSLGERERLNIASKYLYRNLLEPVLPHVKGKELIIVPHDVLHYLPFHALLSPDGRYLIEKYPIYYLSSASLLQFVKDKRRAKGEKVLAFGNPDLGDPNKDLKFAELEAQGVKDLYPQSTLLVRKEATEEKSKALSPGHDIIHFATHAELSERDPLSSAILLARDDKEDGRLEVREIFGMDLQANLVVLSACETGLGKLSSGDELVGLTRAFIYAGTPSVVASLWKVEDSSTAALMASFYKNLKTMTKVEALRQAQLQLIRGEGSSDLLARRGVGGIGRLGEVPETKPQSSTPGPVSVSTSHPYFWAPFILVGDGK